MPSGAITVDAAAIAPMNATLNTVSCRANNLTSAVVVDVDLHGRVAAEFHGLAGDAEQEGGDQQRPLSQRGHEDELDENRAHQGVGDRP